MEQQYWYFRNEETKRFVEKLIQNMENSMKDVEEYTKKVESSKDPQNIELYQNLLNDAKDRVHAYEEMIKFNTTSEHVYTEEELALLDKEEIPEPQTEEEYWDYLAQQAKNESPEQEIEDYIDDITAIKASTEDAVYFAEKADEELTKAEAALEEVIKEAEEFVEQDMNNSIFLADLESKMKGLSSSENITAEQAQTIDGILKDLSNWRNNTPVENLGKLDKSIVNGLAQDTIAKHPIKYMVADMKSALSEIKDARVYYKKTHGDFLENIRKAGKAIAMEVKSNLLPIKTSVMDAAKSACEMGASALNAASTKFCEIAEKGKNLICKGIYKISKFEAKVLDMVTLGAFSKIAGKCESHLQNKVANFDKTNASRFEKAMYHINKAILSISTFYRSEEPEKFWKEVQDDAFLWGNLKDDNGQVIDYARSPVQTIEDGIKKACEKVKDSAESARDFGKDVKLSIEADVLGMKAEVAERMSTSCEKQERRIQSKITQLEKVDKELFEINTQLQQALHKLNAITPFERPKYESNPNIVKSIEELKAIPGNKYAFAIKMLERDLEKEKAKFERKVDKQEKKYNKQLENNDFKKANIEFFLKENEESRSQNLERLEKAKEKLEVMQERGNQHKDSAEKNLAKANEKLEQLCNNSAEERDER